MELFRNTNYDFLGKKWPFIILSLILTAAGLVSLALKGGPRYGIDFKGGALVTVPSPSDRPWIKSAPLSSGKLPVDVQEVYGSRSDDIIGTDVQRRQRTASGAADHRGQPHGRVRPARQRQIQYQLPAGAEGSPTGCAIPLQAAGIPMSEQQLHDLATNIMEYRKQHSGLIRNLDELRSVPGVTPQSSRT